MKNLTVAIPTIVGREKQFDKLYSFLNKQIKDSKLEDKIEIISEKDNKEISIGSKRQILIERAQGKFMVMIDDDDWVVDNFIYIINNTIEAIPECDCIGYYESISGYGAKNLSSISNNWDKWADGGIKDGKKFSYIRTPFFKCPILTEYCQKIGCKDMRWGEDEDFARRLKENCLIDNEVNIDKIMYIYRYKQEVHNEKYGIK